MDAPKPAKQPKQYFFAAEAADEVEPEKVQTAVAKDPYEGAWWQSFISTLVLGGTIFPLWLAFGYFKETRIDATQHHLGRGYIRGTLSALGALALVAVAMMFVWVLFLSDRNAQLAQKNADRHEALLREEAEAEARKAAAEAAPPAPAPPVPAVASPAQPQLPDPITAGLPPVDSANTRKPAAVEVQPETKLLPPPQSDLATKPAAKPAEEADVAAVTQPAAQPLDPRITQMKKDIAKMKSSIDAEMETLDGLRGEVDAAMKRAKPLQSKKKTLQNALKDAQDKQAKAKDIVKQAQQALTDIQHADATNYRAESLRDRQAAKAQQNLDSAQRRADDADKDVKAKDAALQKYLKEVVADSDKEIQDANTAVDTEEKKLSQMMDSFKQKATDLGTLLNGPDAAPDAGAQQ